MKLKSFLITTIALSMAAVLYAQTSQSSQSSSQSKNGSSQSSSSASSSASSSSNKGGFANSGGSRNVGGSHSGSGNGSGSGSGFSINGKPSHAILYTLEANDEAVSGSEKKAFEAHTQYLSDQQMKGKVLLFGPWRDLPGSMALVMAKSDEEANEIAKNDPAVKSGSLTFEVRAWNVTTPSSPAAKVRF